jgi:hypothetical protein
MPHGAEVHGDEAESRFPPHLRTFDEAALRTEPKPKDVIGGYFPLRATTALVAMGGIGKTTWLVRQAIQRAQEGIETLFVSQEDGPADYHAKIYNEIATDHDGQRFFRTDPGDIADCVHVLNLRGSGTKLVVSVDGNFVPSPAAIEIAFFIRDTLRNVRLVVFETLSRFAGGEDNERMEAAVTACDQIATTINGAVVLVHHTGKGQAREKVVDLYSGRGGSALGDNTRSMIVLTRLDDSYEGEQPTLASRADIEAGRVFEVQHVRNSYGPTMEAEYFVTRAGCCHGPVLQPIPIASEKDLTRRKLEAISAKHEKAAKEIHRVIEAKGGEVRRKFFDGGTRDLIGLTQTAGRELIQQMIDARTLVEEERKTASGQTQKVLVVGPEFQGAWK